MPYNTADYPADWRKIANHVKFSRAQGRCECTGECGLHQSRRAGTRCVELHGYPARFARGTICLTTAHLCECQPLCSDPAHLKAMCQRCHLRTDSAKHAATRQRRRPAQALSPSQTTAQA